MKNTEHLFEIPWNGDINLIDRLSCSKYRDKVKFVYLPCAMEDGLCTRTKGQAPVYDRKKLKEIVDIMREAGFEPGILFQRNADPESLPFYCDELKIKYFTVAEDYFAKAIRKYYGKNAYITASITKDLMNTEYEWYVQNDRDLYDVFVLRYGYSRDIDSLWSLPKELKYIIMPNNTCLWDCLMYRYDWFHENNETSGEVMKYLASLKGARCTKSRFREDGTMYHDNVMYIGSEDLWFFDKWVNGYKITDRMDMTENIIEHFEKYASANVEYRPEQVKEMMYKYNLAKGRQIRAGEPLIGDIDDEKKQAHIKTTQTKREIVRAEKNGCEISVITPVYETDQILRRCFDGLKNQTFKDFEVILIDDCSPYSRDHYQSIVEEYSAYFNIKYVATKINSGPGDAKQLGLTLASGRYVLFLDADDVVSEDLFEAVSKIKEENAVIVNGGYRRIDNRTNREDGKIITGIKEVTQGSFISRKFIKDNNLSFNPILSFKEEDAAFYALVNAVINSQNRYSNKNYYCANTNIGYYTHINDNEEGGYKGASNKYDLQNSYMQMLILSIERFATNIKYRIGIDGDFTAICYSISMLIKEINDTEEITLLEDRFEIFKSEKDKFFALVQDYHLENCMEFSKELYRCMEQNMGEQVEEKYKIRNLDEFKDAVEYLLSMEA